MGDARHQQADGEAEEHADGDVAEVVGCHHDAAQGDEEGPDEDAEAVDAIAAGAVVEAEAQEGADGEAEGVAGVAGEESEEAGAVEGPVEAVLQHFRGVIGPETVHTFFNMIRYLVGQDDGQDAGEEDDEALLPAQAVDHHRHDDSVGREPDAHVREEHPYGIAPRAVEAVDPEGDILVDADEPVQHSVTCSGLSRVPL